jgi:uncharacterized repeat protein (TIGR01451 family)
MLQDEGDLPAEIYGRNKMKSLQAILVVLSLLLAPMPVIENESCVEEYEQNTPVQNSCSENSKSSPPISLALPSTIKIWEAWAKGYANISQTIGATYTVKNNGPVNIIIDEYVMLLSPSPANPSEDLPGIDDETQDGTLTTTYTISPGYSFVYNYGDYLNPPLWWCTEDTEWTNSGVPITLGGEILPYDMIQIIQNPNTLTQDNLYYYMNNNPTLVIGKRPLWKEIANIGDVVDITLEITNIGFDNATYVVVKDTIPSNYSYDPTSFTKTPSSITPNPDGSTTLEWKIAKIQAGVKTAPNDPTIYSTEYIGYKLITPVLDHDKRIFLPRAYVDKNNDGTNDAESEKPLLETLLVNQPPVAVVKDIQISEGDTACLDGSSSYDPDEPSGDYIVSYEWDINGDGNPDNYGSMVNLTYGDDGVYTVTLTVTDTYGLSSSTTANITVINVSPIIDPFNDVTINEGQKVTINAHVTDPGSDDLTLTWQFELGPTSTKVFYNDGASPDPYPSPGGTFPFSVNDAVEHLYCDNGKYQVTLKVIDDDGGAFTRTINVTVNNVAPTATLLIPEPDNEGLTFNFSAEATDPGSDDLTFTWQLQCGPTITLVFYNDGIGPDPVKSPWGVYPFNASDSVSHTYGDNYEYNLILTVTDDDGGIFTATSTFKVNNVAPSIIEVAVPITIYEGAMSTYLAKAKDFGSDDLTFEWDFGDSTSIITNTYYNDGANPDPCPSPNGTYPFTASDTIDHVYGDNYDNVGGGYSFSLKVTDDDNGITTFTTNLPVYNIAPTVEPIMPIEIDEGSPFNFIVNSTDPGSDDLTFKWEFEFGPTLTNTYYNDGVGPDPYPSPWGTFPFSASDSVIHTYGDNHEYNLTLTVTDDDGDANVVKTTIIVKNVSPTVYLDGENIIDENSPITLNGYCTDPGSDDLTFTWEIDFGPTKTIIYYNDGIGPDPYPSPKINPMDVLDAITHTYGDNGLFNVTLTVEDDDGDLTIVYTDIIVNNIAPDILNLEAYMYANISIRIAGEKWHSVGIYLYEDGSEIGFAKVTRQPGNPDEQIGTISNVKIDMTKTYTALMDYLPNDPRVNGNVWGGNPVWIDMDFEDGSSKRLHHTFNVRQSDWNSDHWNHIDPWEVEFAPHLLGHKITLDADASDPGSDDLTFNWDLGDGNSIIANIYYNNGLSPDPYPSPEVNPICCSDAMLYAYNVCGTYCITLTVEDDDGDTCVCSITLNVG